MDTLIDLMDRISKLGKREAVRFHNGFRTWHLSYRDLWARIGAVVEELDRSGLRKGDCLLLWGENRPEWIAVFWACVARGIVVVPIDFRSSARLVRRIQEEVRAPLLIHGDEVDAQQLDIKRLSFDDVGDLPPAQRFEPTDLDPQDRVEIVYTSGTTGKPRGVVHRHGNICSNLEPFVREISRYRTWARPFQPIRILQLLPLSHMFGQSMGLFIPPALEGAVVFTSELQPGALIRTVRRERVSVLAAVPRLLKNLQGVVKRDHEVDRVKVRLRGIPAIVERWWKFRKVHSRFGWKFWAFVVGGAQVPEKLEEFWTRLGFAVIQGYGLTETSPVVAVNHPFGSRRGSIGKVVEGQEVRLAEDGEILVRGPSVVTEFLGESESSRIEEGWLHTGDIGEIDEEGRLYYRGRKKEMIVTSEGLNVFPDDVEEVLNRLPGVRDSTVVPRSRNGEEIVHAVLILQSADVDPEGIIREANRRLESHQRIREWSLWPEEDFPRTASTFKVKRSVVARRISDDGERPASEEEEPAGSLDAVLSRLAGGREISDSLLLTEDLGISSLERVELLSRLEDLYGVELDEEAFTSLREVGELKRWIQENRNDVRSDEEATTRHDEKISSAGDESRPVEQRVAAQARRERVRRIRPPRWNRSLPFRLGRGLFIRLITRPLFLRYIDLTVEGLEHLEEVEPPVLFTANHCSNLDTPALFAALPTRWHRRLAPAMALNHFRPYFEGTGFPLKSRVFSGFQYFLACALFNAFPLPQETGGVRRTLRYMGELVARGYSPLVFPEGLRSPDGRMHPFRPGIGFMALRLKIPVVPIHLKGMFEIYSIHDSWPKTGPVRARIGKPTRFPGIRDPHEITEVLEKTIRELEGEDGVRTTE